MPKRKRIHQTLEVRKARISNSQHEKIEEELEEGAP
jgi:hypothetical protein